MHRPTPLNTATLPTPNLISRSSLRRGFRVVFLVLGLFALSPTARAVDPPPDGGYPNGNTAEGDQALNSLMDGYVGNTAIGYQALFSTSAGAHNTGVGFQALFSNTTGSANTATGLAALRSNTTGNSNTATGWQALEANTTGTYNTATGLGALELNTTGMLNTANGIQALGANKTGDNNTATGGFALRSNTIGHDNTANGESALINNTTGNDNTANGGGALGNNATGSENTATGLNVLTSNTTGNNNTGSGVNALLHNKIGSANTADGVDALGNNRSGSGNIAIGNQAGIKVTTGNNNIYIGNVGIAQENGTIRIGKGTEVRTFIGGIYGNTAAGGVPVFVNSLGHLATIQSSARYKEAIKPMDKASEAILALKPVTFRYKQELDPDGISQFGLVAEQVEKVNPDLVVRDEDGKVNTVRYEAVNAMLLNEFLKEHRKVEEQQATFMRLESKVAKQELTAAQQQKQIETLTATVRKVSERVELSAPAPQIAANDD